MKRLLFLFFILLAFTACDPKANLKPKTDEAGYAGPLVVLHDIETVYSQDAVIRMRLKAPTQERYQNGDELFPDGVYIILYDQNGLQTTTLEGNWGKYSKLGQKYQMRDSVVVVNTVEKQQLQSQELNWDQPTQMIFTDSAVKITTASEIFRGYGMKARQDFTQWKILRPTGVLPLQ